MNKRLRSFLPCAGLPPCEMTKKEVEDVAKLLDRKNVRIVPRVDDWKAAVREGAAPLLEGGFIEASYVDAIIESAEAHGPYFVISPKIALPHARPEKGVNASQFSIILLQEAVAFSEKRTEVQLIITMAAVDDSSYLGGLVAISELLQEEETVEEILKAPTADALYDFFQSVNHKEVPHV